MLCAGQALYLLQMVQRFHGALMYSTSDTVFVNIQLDISMRPGGYGQVSLLPPHSKIGLCPPFQARMELIGHGRTAVLTSSVEQ